jgi:hypothetical protein
MSYGSNLAEAYREAGAYVGLIIKGAIPSELSMLQSSKVELVMNGFAARLLGLTIPQTLLVSADEMNRMRWRLFASLMGGGVTASPLGEDGCGRRGCEEGTINAQFHQDGVLLCRDFFALCHERKLVF